MDLVKLFELQENLDERTKKNIFIEKKDLLSKKTLALQVKIAELANETQCFKFWTDNAPTNKDLILKSYVDCLYFILTLGLEKGFTDIKVNIKVNEDIITSQFLNIYIDINDFIVCSSKDHYITLFEDFISLGKKIGLSMKEIETAYCYNHFIYKEKFKC
ncbi:dUTP diphosphatase [Clostridium kluyveri]|uniref:dUTPase n=1 Tax=Clostridium kluyveri TaxID=1534 RepID=A0A1L5F383_CLOKL|nr:dUTP diphosphatase [Clostridium kluyveri]APM37469.1 hypothetical protein BS101_01195 [Clostridium kluyveri]UZQ52573.1 dUTP diphosphatase [Clostridium kluyveri]